MPWQNVSIAAFLALILAGCSSGQVRVYPASDAETFRAVEAVLGSLPLADRNPYHRTARTEWVYQPGARSQGLLWSRAYHDRYRVAARVAGGPGPDRSELHLAIEREERAPGGRLANRWRRARVAPEAYEELFERVSLHLGHELR